MASVRGGSLSDNEVREVRKLAQEEIAQLFKYAHLVKADGSPDIETLYTWVYEAKRCDGMRRNMLDGLWKILVTVFGGAVVAGLAWVVKVVFIDKLHLPF